MTDDTRNDIKRAGADDELSADELDGVAGGMMPKSGSPVTAVEPTAPEEVFEAAATDPGQAAAGRTAPSPKLGSKGLPIRTSTPILPGSGRG